MADTGYNKMIKRFEVENFMGFRERLVFDWTARDYAFNPGLIANGIVQKTLLYGKNGSGKSSLGLAMFDVISHLTDKRPMPMHGQIYQYCGNPSVGVSFRYLLHFGDGEVEYEYVKNGAGGLLRERLVFDGREVVFWNYENRKQQRFDRGEFGDLQVELLDNKLSIVKYLHRNIPSNRSPLLGKMVDFFDRMLWFRKVDTGNEYAGYTNGVSQLAEALHSKGKLEDFRNFLRENGLEYDLEFHPVNGVHDLFARFGKTSVPFDAVASAGTSALYLFYFWSLAFGSVSFLFIDEFDAFFHYESAEAVVRRLNAQEGMQVALTSHNVHLMQNRLTRPDCCFILSGGKAVALCDATEREIREAHNLEKMYVNGAFRA